MVGFHTEPCDVRLDLRGLLTRASEHFRIVASSKPRSRLLVKPTYLLLQYPCSVYIHYHESRCDEPNLVNEPECFSEFLRNDKYDSETVGESTL